MARRLPSVDIVCLCHEDSNSLLPSRNATELPTKKEVPVSPGLSRIPNSLWDPFSRYPLGYLYFCEHCHSHRCPRCVEEEIVCRFCPQCLFEVTPTSARAEGNRCTRNCFRCPQCLTGTRVVPSSNSDKSVIKCPFCDWTSDGFAAKKSTGMVNAVKQSKGRNQTKIDERFKEMRNFYFQRSLEEGMTLAAMKGFDKGPDEDDDTASLQRVTLDHKNTTFAEILEKRIRDKSRKDPGSEIYHDIEEVDESNDQSRAFLEASSTADIYNTQPIDVTPIQRDLIDLKQEYPLPQPLRGKRTKRCKGCHHLLVKPEAKPTSTKFKIKLMALNYFPDMRVSFPSEISKAPVLVYDEPQTVYLTVSNPMHVPMKVVLSTIPSQPHSVTVLAPSFTLGAGAELWDEASLVAGVPSQFIFRETKVTQRIMMEGIRTNNPEEGIIQRGPNWCTIAVEVIPSTKQGVLEVPLFVSFSFTVSSDDNESEDPKNSESSESDEEVISIGFWAVLSVASIKDAGA